MGEIKLLDCTLRDGGYINDWRFGEEEIPDMIEALEQTNVDILEIGFLKDEPYQEERTVFNSMEQVKKLIPDKKPGIEYAVMCEVVNPLPLEMLEPADEDSADIIRVIVWKTKHNDQGEEVDALREGYEYCKGIVEKGYKLCVQPARVSQYSDAEFTAMVKKFSTLNPMAIYVVDSWGTENAESLLHYMHLADDNMPREISLGYHGHNNMMQALSVAQAMLKEGFEREIIIDASIDGIGRGAGNLNLELIAKYLNEQYGKRYIILPMLSVCEKYLYAIYGQEQWGYSVPYFLTAVQGCNPAYARYYRSLPAEKMTEVLSSLSDEERVIYRESTAKKRLKEYNQKKKKLAVIIPTANRHQTIDMNLFRSVQALYDNGIDVIIFDSSKDVRTKTIAKNFQIEGYSNVIYDVYDGEYDGFSLDQKVMAAYERYCGRYEYLWVCRDGLIVNGFVVKESIFPVMETEPDLIIVNPAWCCEKELGNKKYMDCTELFREQCMQMTVLGATILKSSTIRSILDTIPLEKGRNYSLWQPIAHFEYIAENDFLAVSIEANVWNYNPAAPSNSFWKSQAMRQWCEEWYQVITGLPNCYDPYKAEVLKIHMKDFHPFYARELLKMRAGKGLSFLSVRKNKKILPYVCDTPVWIFYVISLLPKSFAKYLCKHPGGKLENCIRGLYFVVRGKLPDEGDADL